MMLFAEQLLWWYMISKNVIIDLTRISINFIILENNIWIGRQYEIDNLTVLRTPPMGAYTLAIDCPEGLCRQRDQRHVAR